jgi:hypothetical protein
MIDYTNYVNFIKNLKSIDNFKSNEDYRFVLEHTSYEQGKEYIRYIEHLDKNKVINYCIKNDKIGGGIKHDYILLKTSPSNFRYLLHADIILKHINSLKLNNLDIVEIGGGYGGLCLAINELNENIKIKSYNLIDLSPVIQLQKQYLYQHKINYATNFYEAFNYGEEIKYNNMFLISNYSFSEINNNHQKEYIKKLFPKVSHGFMTWNFIKVFDFGFSYKEEVEYPLTGKLNKYVYF